MSKAPSLNSQPDYQSEGFFQFVAQRHYFLCQDGTYQCRCPGILQNDFKIDEVKKQKRGAGGDENSKGKGEFCVGNHLKSCKG